MLHQKTRIILLLSLTYFIFAILLNSVGTVILQVINNFSVNNTAASALEGFKDIPIAVVSFLVASYLPHYGYRRAMMTGLCFVAAICAVMPFVPSFFMTKMLFLCTGVSFALVKISVYSTIGLVAEDKKQHASILNIIEGLFMIGVLSGYWLFSLFIHTDDPTSTAWFDVYWYISGLALAAIFLWVITPLDETGAECEGQSFASEFIRMLSLVKLPMVYIFVISVFLYVLIEQGVGTWLPTFNNKILKLPVDMSVQATSIFAACLAFGRIGAGILLRKISWYIILNVCLVCIIALVLLTMPLAQEVKDLEHVSWLNVSPAAYIFPLIGLFMAPVYPAINSVVLSAIDKRQHAAMTGLIVIFSALGGTTGSLMTGTAFDVLGGSTAFYLTIIPVVGIIISLYFFKRSVNRASAVTGCSD